MTDVKRLLDEATPLPWPNQRISGFFDRADAALIVHAVNRLPDYEAAVEALEQVARYSWGLQLAGTPNEAEAIGLIENARAAVRRLRGSS